MKHTIGILKNLTPSVFDEKYILSFSLLATAFNFCYAPFSFIVVHNYWGGCVNTISSVCLLAVIFSRKKKVISRFLAENLLVGIAYLTMFILCYRSGGITSAIIPWFIVVNMFSLTVNNKKVSLFWTAIAILILAYFWIATSYFGYIFPNDYNGAWYTTWFFTCILGVFFLGIKIVGVIEERNAEFIAALKEKNDELFQSREEILELQKYKENFLANITHELRTPLNAIKGVSELLKLPNTKEETTELIDGLNKSSNHLLNMVNDILDFSKLKEGKLLLRHQPFHLKDTIHAACKLLKITASDKGLLFTVDTSNLPETAIGDESRLIQILVNIVGNSIKFTATGSVKVKCFAQYETEKICLVKIKIIDTGIGISKEKVDIIFDDYVQADENVAAKFGGTGLGLGITKRLVELHKGTIVCKSVLKEGTTFNISIQYEYSATRYQSTNVGTFKKIENKVLNIIVADDNKMNVLVAEKLIKKSLSKANVLVASNGKQVIELLEKNKHIDVVLMDMKMPEMDGIEASKLIRQSADYYQLPIIAMTAATSDAEIKQCLDAGMNDYLSKPFYKDELLSKIQNVLIDNKSTVPKAKEIAN